MDVVVSISICPGVCCLAWISSCSAQALSRQRQTYTKYKETEELAEFYPTATEYQSPRRHPLSIWLHHSLRLSLSFALLLS